MNYACATRTVKRVMHEMGYHKRVPRRKFNVTSKQAKTRYMVSRTAALDEGGVGEGHRDGRFLPLDIWLWTPSLGYPYS